MKDSLSKYLIALALLLIGTAILVSSRKVSNNTSNTKDNSNKAITSENLNTSDTLGVTSTSQTKDNISPVKAEQVGSSPDSGVDSMAKQVYDFLVGKSDPDYGATQPADWSFNFGTYWNRMLYSAFWEPDGTATEQDVLSGKTFYSGSNNRVQKTGTGEYETPSFYEEQSLIEYDDYEAAGSPEDIAFEESSWTSPATNVWKDTRTGLYWSNMLSGTYTNTFPNQDHSTCDFFSTVPRGDYGTSGTDPDCGNAINACAILDLTSGGTSNADWYLPSKKELDGAYIDGMYNQAGATFTTTSNFWSSTEDSGDGGAWRVALYSGYSYFDSKTNGYAVRCVRRD